MLLSTISYIKISNNSFWVSEIREALLISRLSYIKLRGKTCSCKQFRTSKYLIIVSVFRESAPRSTAYLSIIVYNEVDNLLVLLVRIILILRGSIADSSHIRALNAGRRLLYLRQRRHELTLVLFRLVLVGLSSIHFTIAAVSATVHTCRTFFFSVLVLWWSLRGW